MVSIGIRGVTRTIASAIYVYSKEVSGAVMVMVMGVVVVVVVDVYSFTQGNPPVPCILIVVSNRSYT